MINTLVQLYMNCVKMYFPFSHITQLLCYIILVAQQAPCQLEHVQ